MNMSKKSIYRSIPMVFDSVSLATDVKAACVELGLSYSDVDRLAGYGTGNTSALIQGKRSNPEMATFLACCNALDLDPRKYFVLK